MHTQPRIVTANQWHVGLRLMQHRFTRNTHTHTHTHTGSSRASIILQTCTSKMALWVPDPALGHTVGHLMFCMLKADLTGKEFPSPWRYMSTLAALNGCVLYGTSSTQAKQCLHNSTENI